MAPIVHSVLTTHTSIVALKDNKEVLTRYDFGSFCQLSTCIQPTPLKDNKEF